jgi:hypothetical protein
MIIDVDLDFLIQHNISANHYLILYLLHKRKSLYLQKYLESNPVTKADLDEMSEKKLIHNISDDDTIDWGKIIIRPRFRELMSDGDFFDEFYETYPLKAIRKDGKTDYLRINNNTCRKLYSDITNNKKTIHKKIISCLDFEIATREREGSMMWFKKMHNWLASEEWKNWEERMVNEPFIKEENKLGYGNELA